MTRSSHVTTVNEQRKKMPTCLRDGRRLVVEQHLSERMLPEIEIWEKRKHFDSGNVRFGVVMRDRLLRLLECFVDRLNLALAIHVETALAE